MFKIIIYFVVCMFTVMIPSGIASFNVNKDQIILLDYHGFRNEITAHFDPLLGFRLKPRVTMNGFRHNSYGFIGPEFRKEKPNGRFRIFCLGGSTTLGAGVMADFYSYPGILQSIFDKTLPHGSRNIEIINAGVFGYNSIHTYIQISELLDVYNPDMYIIMDGLNDLDLAQHYSLNKLQNIFGKKASETDVGSGIQDIETKFSLIGFQRNLQDAISHAKREDIQVVLVSDPMQSSPHHATQLSMNNPGLASLLEFGRTALPKINRALAAENDIPFVDTQNILDAFLASPEQVMRVWADDLHLTRYGYYLLARDVYHQLMTMPDVQHATGMHESATDEKLDLLFPGLVQWRPADGMGWPKAPTVIHGEIKTNNLKDTNPDDEWSFFAPLDPARPAELSLTPDPSIASFRIYPRIQSSADSVTVFQISSDGQRHLLFTFQKPTDDGLWSPQTAWYEVRKQKGLEDSLIIQLTGENAQLWHQSRKVLFAQEPCE